MATTKPLTEARIRYLDDYRKEHPGLYAASSAKYRASAHGKKKRAEYAALRHPTRAGTMTKVEFAAMVEAQHGVCAMCGRDNGKRNLCVDHDHKTKKVRGLLCIPCNILVGYAEHPLLVVAHAYLAKAR